MLANFSRRSCLQYLCYGLILAFIVGFICLSYLFVFTLEFLPWNPPLDVCKHGMSDLLSREKDEITVVTMFIDIGIFKKGEMPLEYHSPYKYRRWMRVFGGILNKVVAYMETDNDVEYFRNIRSCLPANFTKIIKVNRNDLPAFSHLQRVKEIYSDPSYPEHFPNTVSAEYACSTHAKYDVIKQVCEENPFQTPYIAWLDIGYFRQLEETGYEPFKLLLPQNFNPNAIAMSHVWPQLKKATAEDIMKKNLVWLAGGMVLAKAELMMKFASDYQSALLALLNRGLSNTDQGVIGSMYSPEMKKADSTTIQMYKCKQGQMGLCGPAARYMCLGYLSKLPWDTSHGKASKNITKCPK